MQNFVARGTVNPCRFVKVSLNQDNAVEQAGSNDRPYGISALWIHDAPIPGAGTDAASSGEMLKVYDLGETCLLELAGTVARDDMLISDTNGKGVVTATTGTTIQWIGATALEAGVSGNLIRVSVVRFPYRPALS